MVKNFKSLRESIKEAEEKKVAIGHFNISNLEGVWAVFNSARKLGVPVIIGVSEGERDFVGVRQIRAIVTSLQEEFDYPIYLNADHTYSFERVKEAVEAGYDSVIFDGAKLSFDENVKITKQCADFIKDYNHKNGTDILLEAEFGYIGQSSKILDGVPDGVSIDEGNLTDSQQAKEFVESTGVDLFAPAVGNIHGMFRGGVDPALHIDLVKEIKDVVKVPLVLHGGSGNSKEDFQNSIKNGISIVHINTELRVAFRKGLELGLEEKKDEVAPYKFLKRSREEMEKLVEEKLKLFNML
jgi:fructose-bisphosphate aldolase class II